MICGRIYNNVCFSEAENYWSIFVIYNSFWTSLVGWLSQKTSPFWKLWLYFEENFVKYQYFGERVGLGKVWPK